MSKLNWLIWVTVALLAVVWLLSFLSLVSVLILGIIVLLWLAFSIKFLKPEEMAIFVFFGKPWWFCDSGFRFVPWLPYCYLARFPKKMYNLDFPARKVITKREEEQYGTQVLEVDSVAYLRFPRDDNLITILQSEIPTTDEELMDWVEEKVVSSIRVVVSNLHWREAIENLEHIEEDVTGRLEAHNALLEVGFTPECIDVTVKEIRLPPKLEDALPRVDKQRLESEAALYGARERAIETMGSLVNMIAEATGLEREEVQRRIQNNEELPEESQAIALDLVRRRMAIDGNSFVDIRVEGAEGMEKGILGLIASWKKLSGAGAQASKPAEGKEGEGKPKKPEDETFEEQKAFFEKQTGMTLP